MRYSLSLTLAILALSASLGAGPHVLARNNADGYLVDAAQALTPDVRAEINAKLLAYKARTSNEFAVVILPSLEGSDIQTYANTLFHTWGIGVKGKDNGVLLLWSLKERKVRLEVGRGLEESLPDGRAGLIIRDTILPNFKAQRWAAGVGGGVDAVIAQLDFKPVALPVKAVAPSTPASLDLYFILGFLALGIGVVALMVWYNKEDDPIAPVLPDLKHPYPASPSTYSDFSSRPIAKSAFPVASAKRVMAPPTRPSTPSRRSEPDRSYIPIPIPIPYSSPSSDSGFSSSSSFGSSDSGSSFGGGDSGGGGADGGY